MTKLIQKFLLLWLILLSLTAYYWPRTKITFDPFSQKFLLPYFIIVTMFAVGWMLPVAEVKQVFRRWPVVLGGTAVQFIAMPLLAVGVGHLMGFQGEYLIGIFLVGCVPGAMASNVLTIISKGNVSYSVSLTTLATLLSPIAVPLLLKLQASFVDPNTAQIMTTAANTTDNIYLLAGFKLLMWVVIPVIAGFILGRFLPQYESHAKMIGSNIANLSILIIIATVVGLSRDKLADLPGHLFTALLLINLVGYGCGQWGGQLLRISPAMKRALTLEVGMQNAGLGAALAADLFPDRPTIYIAPAFYTFFCMFTGTLLAWYWSFKQPLPATSTEKVNDNL